MPANEFRFFAADPASSRPFSKHVETQHLAPPFKPCAPKRIGDRSRHDARVLVRFLESHFARLLDRGNETESRRNW